MLWLFFLYCWLVFQNVNYQACKSVCFALHNSKVKIFVSSISKQAILLNTISLSNISPFLRCQIRNNPQLRNLEERKRFFFIIICEQVTMRWKEPPRESIAKWWNRKFWCKVCDNPIGSLYEAGLSNNWFHRDVYLIITHRNGL